MTTETCPFSFRDAAVLQDLFPAFDRLREISPVFRSAELRMVVVTGYEECMEVLKDPVRFSNKRSLKNPGGNRQPEVKEVLAQGYPYVDTLMNTDGIRHDHHAGLVKSYLSAKQVRALEGPVTAMAQEALDRVKPGHVFDFVDVVSLPLTIDVLCHFTGVPREHHELVELSTEAEVALLGALNTVEENVTNARVIVRMQHLLGELIDERTTEPRGDLISHLVHAPVPEGCEPLTKAELVSILRGVVIGGNETTRGLINSMVHRLACEPDVAARIRRDPDAFDRFIDEALRATSPVAMLFRVATADTEISGVAINEGELIGVAYGAANHDPARFEDPYAWDIDRPTVRRHLAFGYGAHYCAGSPLGRLEARVVIREMLQRYDRIELEAGSDPRWVPSFMVRNIATMPLRLIPTT